MWRRWLIFTVVAPVLALANTGCLFGGADLTHRISVRVKRPGPEPDFGFEKLDAPVVEPLRAELEAFLDSVRTRKQPKTDGISGRASLELAVRVMQSIQEHAERVQLTDSSRAPRPAASPQNEVK